MTTPIVVPPVRYTGVVTPPPVMADLSPTGPYRAAILGSHGTDGSSWEVQGDPGVLNPQSRWVYTSATGPSNPGEALPNGATQYGMSWAPYGAVDQPMPEPGVGWATWWAYVYKTVGSQAVPGIAFQISAGSWTVDTNGEFTVGQPIGQCSGWQYPEDYGNVTHEASKALPITQVDALTSQFTIDPAVIATIDGVPYGWSAQLWGLSRCPWPAKTYFASAMKVRMVVPAGYNGPTPSYIMLMGGDGWTQQSGGDNPGIGVYRWVVVPASGEWAACDGFSGPGVPPVVPVTW
jgi:hypothetical protein